MAEIYCDQCNSTVKPLAYQTGMLILTPCVLCWRYMHTCSNCLLLVFFQGLFFQQEGKRKPEVKQQGRQIGLCVSLRAAMNSEEWLLKYTRDQVFLSLFFLQCYVL